MSIRNAKTLKVAATAAFCLFSFAALAQALTFSDIYQVQTQGQVLGASTIILVNHAKAGAASQTGAATVSSLDCSTGSSGNNLLVMVVSNYNSSAAAVNVNDSINGNWTSHSGNYLSSNQGSLANVAIWWKAGASVSTNMTFSATGNYPQIFVMCFSGVDPNSPKDAESGGPGPSGSQLLNPGNITPAGANEAFVTGLAVTGALNSAPTISGGTPGFSVLDWATTAPGLHTAGASAYEINTSGSSENTTWNNNMGGDQVSAMVSFLPSGSGGGGGSAPTITSFTASPTSITSGQSSNLSWSTSGATSASISSVGSVSVSGSSNVNPTVTTTYTLTATNSSGSATANATVTVTGGGSDTIPPNLSAISSSGLTSSSASITWTTDENSDSQVDYGLTNSYGSSSALNSSLTTSHNTSLSSLSASTLYHYRVKSKDSSGNLAVSADQSFTTSASSGGGALPTITWVKQTLNTANWPGFRGYLNLPYVPSSGNIFIYAGPPGTIHNEIIYSTDEYLYNSVSHTFSHLGGSGDTVTNCNGTATQPSDRHPGHMVVDTLRNRVYLIGGLNSQTCGGGHANDVWYLPLGGSPPLSWVKVTTNTFMPDVFNNATWSGVYDPDDDVIFMWGSNYSYPNHFVYCVTNADPIMRSKQVAAGCANGNDINAIAATGQNGNDCNVNPLSCPAGVYFTNTVYDTIHKKVIQWGGTNTGGTVDYTDTWAYDVPTKHWTKMCGTGCTSPGNPANSNVSGEPALAWDPTLGLVFYHQAYNSGAPQDWVYDYGSDRWTQLTSIGGGPGFGTSCVTNPALACEIHMQYDVAASKLVTWGNDLIGNPQIWEGSLGSGGGGSSDVTPPSVPTGINAVASSTSVSLSWTASTDNVGVSFYTVYRNGSVVGSPGTNSFNDTGLTPNTNYSYTISATDSSGNSSSQSATKAVTTIAGGSDSQAPTTPTSLLASAGSSSSVNLSWTASTDNVAVTGYKIFRNSSQVGTSATNSYSDSGLVASTAYTYTVSAYDAAGNNSNQSSSAQATTLALGGGNVITPLTIQEAIYPGSVAGVTRTQDPLTVGIPLAQSANITNVSQLGLSNSSVGQFRVLGCWSGSPTPATQASSCGGGAIKWVLVDTEADITAGQNNTNVSLTTGSGSFGGSNLATDNGTTITVNTGLAQFTIKKANFNVIDTAVVNGKTIVSPGTSQGLVLTGPNPTAAYPANVTCGTGSGQSPCTTVYSSANDPNSTCSIEENGPVKSVIICNGTHFDSTNHPYMQYTVREYFYYGKTTDKVESILRNANYNTSATPSPDRAGNTFNTAYKGFQSYELRLNANISGTLNYSIANDTVAPTTGTLSQNGGSDSAYIYQGQSKALIGNSDCTFQSVCANMLTPDLGFSIKKNGSNLVSGSSTQYPQGWADVNDSSGAGVSIGIYQMAAYFPKSLEFDNGGNDIRIGIFPSQNSQPTYQAWPAWNIQDLYLNFHDSSLASPANEFLKFQHALLARAPYTYYNATNVFPYPITDPASEDAYMVATQGASSPSLALSGFCYGGGTTNCLPDRGTTQNLITANYPLSVYRYWSWSNGGPATQLESRWSDLQNWIQRGEPGRFLNSSNFYNFEAGDTWPHSDGGSASDSTVNGFSWRNRPHAGTTGSELDGFGHPSIGCGTSNPPGASCPTLTNSTKSFVDWGDPLHDHWYGITDYYFMTGDETMRDAVVSKKDFYLNPDTYQGAHYYNAGGGLGYVRSIGIELLSTSRFSDYLKSIGDSDANGVLAQGLQTYTDIVKPDLCVNGFPSGCTPDPVNKYGNNGRYDNPGVSRVRGMFWSPESRGLGWCSVSVSAPSNNAYRGNDLFQSSLIVEGLLSLRKTEGASWSDHNLSLDLAYGIGQWATSEAFRDNGSNSWFDTPNNSGQALYNGFSVGIEFDIPQTCSAPGGLGGVAGSDYGHGALVQFGGSGPVYDPYSLSQADQGMWMLFYPLYLTNGSLNSQQQKELKIAIQNDAKYGLALFQDAGHYGINTAIGAAVNSSQPVLSDVPFTVQDQGSGNYQLTWTVPASAQSYRIKWSPKIIAPSSGLLNFDPMVTQSFGLDPNTYSTWFGANNVTEPAPLSPGASQSFTINTATTGLVAADFSVKAYVSANPNAPVISSFTSSPSSINSGGSSTLSWSVSNSTSLSIDQGVGTVTGTSKVVSPTVTTTYTLTATNGSGSVTQTATVTVSAPQAPIISSLVASNLTATSTTLSWQTDVPADTQVSYGLTASYGQSSTLTDTSPQVTSHSVTLSSLTPATTYHFSVLSRGANSLLAQTGDFTFTTLSLPLPPAPSISSFTANPSAITIGQSSVLSFTVTGSTTSLSLNQGIGSVLGQNSKSISPIVSTTYTLTAQGPGGTATAQVTVTVGTTTGPTTTAPTILSFTINPSSIILGQTVTLNFQATGTPTPTLSIDNSIGTVLGLTKTITPSTTTTYTLTAVNSAGTATAQATVNVTAAPTGGGGSGGSSGGTSGGAGGSGTTNTTVPTVNPDGSITFIPKAITPTSTPSSALRLINSNGTFYLIKNNLRYGITSPGILYSYGFEFKDAKTATQQDLSIPLGTLLLPGNGYLVKSAKDKTVYLISNNQRYAFTSAVVFTSLGFSFTHVFLVTDPELQSLPQAQNISDPNSKHLPGLDINRNGTIYWVGTDNLLHGYPNLSVYNSWHRDNDFSQVVTANAADLSLPVGGLVVERIVN